MALFARRTSKPPPATPIDRSHPLAQGLVACWFLSEGSGLPVDSASLNPSASSSAAWAATPSGPGLSFSSSYVGLGAATPWLNVTGAVTLAFLGTPATAANQKVIAGFQSSSPFAGYALGVGGQPGFTSTIDYFTGATGTWVSSSSGQVDGGRHMFSATCDAGGNVSFYRDGKAAGTASSAAPNSWTGQRALGARSDGLAGFYSGPMEFAGVWARAFTAADHGTLAANPWQLALAQSYRYFGRPRPGFWIFGDQIEANGIG